MDRLGVYLDNLSNKIIHKANGDSAEVTRKWGHDFLVCLQVQACYYSQQELRNMHLRFGHPSVSKLSNVFKTRVWTTNKKEHI